MALSKLEPGAAAPEGFSWHAPSEQQQLEALLPKRPLKKYWTTADGKTRYALDSNNDVFFVTYVRMRTITKPWLIEFRYSHNAFLEQDVPQQLDPMTVGLQERFLDHYSKEQQLRFYRRRDAKRQQRLALPSLTRAGVAQAFGAATSKLLWCELVGKRETTQLLDVLLLELFGPPHPATRA